MTLMNLYNVTKTLKELLRLNITTNIDPSLDGDLQVTDIPPEKLNEPSYTLNIFLYHIAEDTYYKNILGPGNDVPNVAKTPMALNLFYILTAYHEVGDTPQFEAEQQQKIMGYALKTFHDFPVITDQTQIDGTPILDSNLQGKDNSLQVILRTVSAEDAIAFWGSEDTRTVRLSAYYEVRVIMLEPEPPQTMPGIVLNLGSYLVQLGSPHLESSQSLVSFQLPQRNGGSTQEITASPARVTLNSSLEPLDPADPPDPYNRFQLLGTNLTAGRSRSLILKNSIWSNPPSPDSSDSTNDSPIEAVAQVIVDLEQNPTWNVEFSPDRIDIEITSTLVYLDSDGTAINLPMLPGFYSVSIRSVLNEQIINGELKQITVTSNEIGFVVAPRLVLGYQIVTEIMTITVEEDEDDEDDEETTEIEIEIIDITLGEEFDLLDSNIPRDSIQVIVAGEVYTESIIENNGDEEPEETEEPENPVDFPSNPREFFITDDSPNLIRINPHFSISVSEPIAYPFRLIVNGAESAPFWIEINPPNDANTDDGEE